MIATLAALALTAAPRSRALSPDLPNVVVETVVERLYSPGYRRCVATVVSDNDTAVCANVEADRWDKRLNAAYQLDLNSISPAEQADLRSAQRAWVAFRQADWTSRQHGEDWGSGAAVDAARTRLRLTAERALQLEDFPPGGCGKVEC